MNSLLVSCLALAIMQNITYAKHQIQEEPQIGDICDDGHKDCVTPAKDLCCGIATKDFSVENNNAGLDRRICNKITATSFTDKVDASMVFKFECHAMMKASGSMTLVVSGVALSALMAITYGMV